MRDERWQTEIQNIIFNKQNKTKQNKTKQNKTKHTITINQEHFLSSMSRPILPITDGSP
jgi:hypothetical protein